MGRILAIDYGRKRTGIAVTDTLQIVANGLTTVPTHQLLTFLKQYVAKEPVERIVVGLPKQMNNEPSESMRFSSLYGAKRLFARRTVLSSASVYVKSSAATFLTLLPIKK